MYNITYILSHPKQDYFVCVCQSHLINWLIAGWNISLTETTINASKYVHECIHESHY